ncbi:MAG: nucleotidyl transferase AbiEii/AbiGii toxin family protein [Polyangiaceae bacterium]|jgi:predicted nucleotidyltransferase
MPEPTDRQVQERMGQSYALDRLWGETMGLTSGDTKEKPLREVIAVLEATGTAYAVIGGIAMQIHSPEPRTTLDIDLAVRSFAEVPSDALAKAGFVHEGRYAHSDNWRAPGNGPRGERVPVQFSAEDVGIHEAIARARVVDAGGFRLRVAAPFDLLVLKLAAAEEPRRRPTKRLQDMTDIVLLSKEFPEVAAAFPDLQERVNRLAAKLLTVGRDRDGPER